VLRFKLQAGTPLIIGLMIKSEMHPQKQMNVVMQACRASEVKAT
jgi:hypothetical protein